MNHFFVYENESQINMDLKCPICLEPFRIPVCDARCRHIFCDRCLDLWLHQKRTCPVCRQYFTEFGPLTDETLLKRLGELTVRCVRCHTATIRRADFDDHIQRYCSKSIKLDLKEYETWSRLTCALNKIKESDDDDRFYNPDDENVDSQSLPMWVMLVSSAHLLIYFLFLIPIAIFMYMIDCIFGSILRATAGRAHIIP